MKPKIVGRFYLRWGVILLIGLVITGLSVQRYYREVHSLTLDQFQSLMPDGTARIIGRIEAGSLLTDKQGGQASFTLEGDKARVPVQYKGESLDDLRELKTLVMIGQWNPSLKRFEAEALDLVPNFAFIIGAYLLLLPLAFFLFLMEHRVLLLYNEIKDSKLYESEEVYLETK